MIYLASSWRNPHYDFVLNELRLWGWNVYDFKNDTAFHWSDIDPNWQSWSEEQFIEGLKHPIAQLGFESDFEALKRADIVVLILPCGRSAHLELGYAIGRKRTAILTNGPTEPELMYNMVDGVFTNGTDLMSWLNE